MAYKQYKLKAQLQVILNYGENEGKIKRKTKTYSDITLDEAVATAEAVYETSRAMGSLMEPIIDSRNVVMTYGISQTNE
ncbi:hypothetical protein LI142_21280 [Eubacterium limosum]|uniref:DUF1659 domain-containing protein n=1 Tax=Eubacterium limosum TaxID=1736 RepID=A0ABT5UQD4_EUBLI|nr:hypothetical protein [Eubacterium limosum]MCB6572036.1 hypothetical protein [Eubacterium limosum]MDE1471150.1 hypothetical protein [Eubacterium limosum]